MVGACPFPVPQGSQVFLRDTALLLRGRGHDVHLVVYGYGTGEDTSGLRVHRARRVVGARKTAAGPSLAKPLQDLLLAAALRRVVREEHIDVVCAHNYEALLVAVAVGHRPIVYMAHNALGDELPHYFWGVPAMARVGAWVDRAIPRRADAVVAPHARLGAYLVACGCPTAQVHVVPPAAFSESPPLQGGARSTDLLRGASFRATRPSGPVVHAEVPLAQIASSLIAPRNEALEQVANPEGTAPHPPKSPLEGGLQDELAHGDSAPESPPLQEGDCSTASLRGASLRATRQSGPVVHADVPLAQIASSLVAPRNEAPESVANPGGTAPDPPKSPFEGGLQEESVQGEPAHEDMRPPVPCVLYTGNLDRYQNLPLLFAAMARVRAEMPGARLLVATAERVALPGAEVVHTPDWASLQRVLAQDCVLAVPRVSWSGYPIKLLNGMAAGRATVACAGAAHPLTDGVDGLVVPDDDAEAFAGALLRLLRDGELRRRLGAQARETALRAHAPERVAEALEAVLMEVWGRRRD
jgi:glycosyltransferase involved in cell wall biosynthesis